jgi:hypothetical protein
MAVAAGIALGLLGFVAFLVSASAAAWRRFIPRDLTNTIVKSESSRDSATSMTREARSAEAKRGAEAETSEHLI